MEAKETVIKDTKKINELFYYKFGFPMMDKLLEAQAELSFKAGYEQCASELEENYLLKWKQEGIREVVEWLRGYAEHGGEMPLSSVLIDLEAHSPYGKPNLKSGE